MYRLLFLVFIWSFSINCPAQPKGVRIDGSLLAKIQFTQLDGGVPLITCKLEGMDDSLYFLLDTGSGGVSLDSSFCAKTGLDTKPSDSSIIGISGSIKARFVFNKKIQIASLHTDPMNFNIYDYSALSAVYGERIDGILGFPFISQYIICLDYDSLTMTYFSKSNIHYPKNGTLLKPRINKLPLQQAVVKDGKKRMMNFFMDSGAGLGVLFSEQFSRDSSLPDKRKKTFYTRAEGLGGSKQMRLTVLESLTFGKYHFKDVPLYIFDDIQNVTAYPKSGGLIGNEILKRFNTVFNYTANEIYIVPNSHFEEPFDYGYAGLTLHLVNDNIVVDDVVPGGPADKAGIIVGDLMLSVDRFFSGSLKLYRSILQSPNKKIDVIISRDGILKQFEIVTETIL